MGAADHKGDGDIVHDDPPAHVHGDFDAGGFCNRLVLDADGAGKPCGWQSPVARGFRAGLCSALMYGYHGGVQTAVGCPELRALAVEALDGSVRSFCPRHADDAIVHGGRPVTTNAVDERDWLRHWLRAATEAEWSEPCRLDHHGECQNHGYGPPCLIPVLVDYFRRP